jgi:anti-sigma regulatory factor (Ser/Thr protein kinase)
MTTRTSRPVLQRELLATKASMGVARNAVVGELRRAGLEGAVADARLITDELVMNAIDASPAVATVRVDLTWWPDGLVLSVWDCRHDRMPWHRPSLGRDLPDAQPDPKALDPGHDCLDMGGWGLQLAEALSQRLWSTPTTTPQGKWVCALLRT